MEKNVFVKVINQMEELHREEEEFNDTLRKIDRDFGGGYIHSKSLSLLSGLLKELLSDEYDYIEFYMWELDFGKAYKDGVLTEDDGTPIPLRTPEELYDLITNN